LFIFSLSFTQWDRGCPARAQFGKIRLNNLNVEKISSKHDLSWSRIDGTALSAQSF